MVLFHVSDIFLARTGSYLPRITLWHTFVMWSPQLQGQVTTPSNMAPKKPKTGKTAKVSEPTQEEQAQGKPQFNNYFNFEYADHCQAGGIVNT